MPGGSGDGWERVVGWREGRSDHVATVKVLAYSLSKMGSHWVFKAE